MDRFTPDFKQKSNLPERGFRYATKISHLSNRL